MSVARDRRSLLAYHAARLISYTTAGAVAGALGRDLVKIVPPPVKIFVLALMALVLFTMAFAGLRTWHGPRWVQATLSRLQRNAFARRRERPLTAAFSIGALSVFLPCGHLYLFLASAAWTGTWWQGAGVMAIFTVSTWPALMGGLAFLQTALSPARRRQAVSALLILAGLASLSGFAASVAQARAEASSSSTPHETLHCH
jgi:sulfite exporter TauE/SafE